MTDDRPPRRPSYENNDNSGYGVHHRISTIENEVWRLKRQLEEIKKEEEDEEPVLRFALKKWQLYLFASFLLFLATSKADPEKVIVLLNTLAQALAAK